MLQSSLTIKTQGRGLYAIDNRIRACVSEVGLQQGLCQVFLQHTSASLILCENADSSVQQDLENFMARLVPDKDTLYRHTAEGADDMPAHIRSVLTANSLTVPIIKGDLGLGTWQGIYLWEHRYRPHERYVIVTIMGIH